MNVILDTDRASLIHGETLSTLVKLGSKSFSTILTDPPYSKHVHANLGKERRNDGRGARDSLPFPPMNDEAIFAIAEQFVRLCTGWILIHSDFYSTATWGRAIQDAGGAWVRTGQWVKTNPMPQMTGDRPACGAEDILIAHASPDTVEGRRNWEWAGKGHAALWRGPRDASGEVQPTLLTQGDFPVHPNQKPEWLIQTLLGQFAPAGSLVLDAYAGSGTTFAAALRRDRAPGEVALDTGCTKCLRKLAEAYAPPLPVGLSVVGIEGDPQWFPTIEARIKNALAA